jgi:hypothetical protein
MSKAIIRSLEKEFDFLETDYGFKKAANNLDAWSVRWTPSLVYSEERVAVVVEYDVKDTFLGVKSVRLDENESFLGINRFHAARAYAMNAIAYAADPSAVMGSQYDEPEEAGPRSFERYVQSVARQLPMYADDLLRADFSRHPRIELAAKAMMAARSARATRVVTGMMIEKAEKAPKPSPSLSTVPQFLRCARWSQGEGRPAAPHLSPASECVDRTRHLARRPRALTPSSISDRSRAPSALDGRAWRHLDLVVRGSCPDGGYGFFCTVVMARHIRVVAEATRRGRRRCGD